MAKTKKDKKSKSDDVEMVDKKGKKKGVTVVDFSKEVKHEGGGGRWLKRVAEGDYVFTIKSIEETRANSGNKMLVVIFVGKEGRVRNQNLRDRFVLVPNSLFRLRQMLEAVGVDVPQKGVQIEHKKLIGKDVGITLRDGDEYEGKIRSEAGDYMPADDVVPMSDDGGSKKKGKGKKKGKKDKDSLEDLDLDSI